MFGLCVCSVCLHGDHFSVLHYVRTVLQASRFVSSVAFGDHRAHETPALFTLDYLEDISFK